MKSPRNRVLLALAVILAAIFFGTAEYLSGDPARVVAPFAAGIVACAGAVLVWDFFGLSRRFFCFFIALAALYASVPLIRLCVGSDLRPAEFLVACEAACAALTPLLFLWFVSGQAHSPKVRLCARVASGLLAAALIIFPASLWCYYIAMNQLLTSDIILALAQTDGKESLEYVQAHFTLRWALAGVFMAVLLSFYMWLLGRVHVSRSKPFKGRFACGIFLFVVSVYDLVNVIPVIPYMATSVLKVTSIQLQQFDRYSEASEHRRQMLAQLGGIACLPGHAGIYVLILGESENRDHMSVFGYPRPTTPFMDSLSGDPHTLFFPKAYSSFPQTVPSLTYALTGKNQYNNADLVNSFSLLEVARRAGFKVWWLSNQRKFGVYETPISVISSSADHEFWLNSTAKMYGLFYDEELADNFPDLKGTDNALVIVHLMGSHERYNERIPPEAMIFEGSADPRTDDYDDTVRYTDDNVRKIYEKVSAHPRFKAMVYISDHGEDVTEQFDHNPAAFTFPMVRVPLMITVSDAYARDNRGLMQALRLHRRSVFTNDLTFDLMAGLMGLKGVPQYERRFDLSSPGYGLNEKNAMTMHNLYKASDDPEFPRP